MKDNCDECNKEVNNLEWSADDEGGYLVFCSRKCGIKFVKKNAERFVFHSQSDIKNEK